MSLFFFCSSWHGTITEVVRKLVHSTLPYYTLTSIPSLWDDIIFTYEYGIFFYAILIVYGTLQPGKTETFGEALFQCCY